MVSLRRLPSASLNLQTCAVFLFILHVIVFPSSAAVLRTVVNWICEHKDEFSWKGRLVLFTILKTMAVYSGGSRPILSSLFSFSCSFRQKIRKIRMHSSSMRTVRFSGNLFGGWGVSAKEVVCFPNGAVCSMGSAWGVSAWGVCHTPPCGQTDAYESITLPQISFADGNNRLSPPLGLAPPGKSRIRHWFIAETYY